MDTNSNHRQERNLDFLAEIFLDSTAELNREDWLHIINNIHGLVTSSPREWQIKHLILASLSLIYGSTPDSSVNLLLTTEQRTLLQEIDAIITQSQVFNRPAGISIQPQATDVYHIKEQ